MFDLQPIKTDIEIKGFNSIYYFEFGKDFTHQPESHDFWEIVYVDTGRVISVSDGVEVVLRQGQAIFHEPMEVHAHISDTKTPNNLLIISFTTDSELMSFFSKKTITLNKTAKTLLALFAAEAKASLNGIPGDYNNKNALDFSDVRIGTMQMLNCYLTEFLINLIRNESNTGSEAFQNNEMRTVTQSDSMKAVAEYLRENIYANLTLDDLCSRFMIGKSRLCSAFRQNMGGGVMDYFAELKISEAKKMLRTEGYSVGQISDMLGYSCIHTFSRAFKKRVGFSPLEYRKSIDFNNVMEE